MGSHILIEKCGNISLEITSVQLTGETRPLRARWTPELAQDLDALDYYTNSYQPEEPENVYKKILLTEKYIPCNFKSIDIEEELSNILATEVAASINSNIFGSLSDLENE